MLPVVELVVVSIHEARRDRRISFPHNPEPTTGVMDAEHYLEDAVLDGDEINSYNDANEVADSNDMPPQVISDATVREDGDA